MPQDFKAPPDWDMQTIAGILGLLNNDPRAGEVYNPDVINSHKRLFGDGKRMNPAMSSDSSMATKENPTDNLWKRRGNDMFPPDIQAWRMRPRGAGSGQDIHLPTRGMLGQ